MTLDQAFDAGLLIDEAGRPIVSRKQLADAKWITVHPNGAGSKGTPVQISENGTVLAGMGGKFNGKKLGELKGGKSMSLEQFLASHGVSTNPPADPTLHQNRHKVEKRHQEALARLSKAQNEWSAKKTELTALYKSKLKSGEITAPDEVERLKRKAEAIPESESGQAAARLAAKIEARRLARSGGSTVEQSIARQSAEKFTGSWLTKTPSETTRTKDPAINTNSSSSEILSTIERHTRSLPTSKQRINARNRMKKSVVESLQSDISNVKSQIRVEMSKGARQGELRDLYAKVSVLERKRDDVLNY